MEYTAEEQAHRDKLIKEIEEMRVLIEDTSDKPTLRVVK